jgi:hypothetical protein
LVFFFSFPLKHSLVFFFSFPFSHFLFLTPFPTEKTSKAARNSGIPEAMKQKMQALGHVMIGPFPKIQRRSFSYSM